MVILMVITCTSLLFPVFYLILDVTFLEFTYISIFCWILKDVGITFISFHYYLDIIITKLCLDIKLSCLGRNLLCWESLHEVLMVCIIYECICFFIPFWYHLGWVVMRCLYLSYLHYIPPMPCICFIMFCVIFCQCLSRIMFRYCHKYEHSLTPNVLIKTLQLMIIRKLECMILLDIQIGLSLKVSFLLLIFSTSNIPVLPVI